MKNGLLSKKKISLSRAGGLIYTLLFSLSMSCMGQSNDIKIIKDRIVVELMASKTNDNNVEAIMAKMNDDGSFKGINYDDLSRTASFPHGGHTRDLAYMARAYKQKTSKLYQNQKLKELIIKGLAFWVKNEEVP